MIVHMIAGALGGFPLGCVVMAVVCASAQREREAERMCAQCGKHIAHFCAGCTTTAILKSRPVRGANGKFKKRETLSV